MPSPFPGMDPWLEHPALWPGVHHAFVTYSRDQLQPRVGPRYYVDLEVRVYVESEEGGSSRHVAPDTFVVEVPRRATGHAAVAAIDADPATVVLLQDALEVREGFIEIRSLQGDRVVTVIELLSWANKRKGSGREKYLPKQAEVLASDVNLVEIDLLRGGEHTVGLPEALVREVPFRVVVSRASDRRRRWIHRIGLWDRLPRVAIPLLAPDPDVVLDLGAVLALVYEGGAYERRIDYARDPEPPLGTEDAARAREVLARARG